MTQPTLRFLNFCEFRPINPTHETYQYLGGYTENGEIFYKIRRAFTVDQDSTVYLVNEKANTASTWEVRLESDKHTVHTIKTQNIKSSQIVFLRNQIVLSIYITLSSAIILLVSSIFAGFKFYCGIKRVSWLIPISSLVLSLISTIYFLTLQRKALFGVVNIFATIVDLRLKNISITNAPSLCNESLYSNSVDTYLVGFKVILTSESQ